jgi:hypothetical protein
MLERKGYVHVLASGVDRTIGSMIANICRVITHGRRPDEWSIVEKWARCVIRPVLVGCAQVNFIAVIIPVCVRGNYC